MLTEPSFITVEIKLLIISHVRSNGYQYDMNIDYRMQSLKNVFAFLPITAEAICSLKAAIQL